MPGTRGTGSRSSCEGSVTGMVRSYFSVRWMTNVSFLCWKFRGGCLIRVSAAVCVSLRRPESIAGLFRR